MQSNPSTTSDYFSSHRDQDYWSPSAVTSDSIEFVTTEPGAAIEAEAPQFRGRFKPGFDSRRHRFSKDECSKGFWAAVESIVSRHPNAVMPDGRHMACNFLKSRQQAF